MNPIQNDDVITIFSQAYPQNLYYFPIKYDMSLVNKGKLPHNIHTILRLLSKNIQNFSLKDLLVRYIILNRSFLDEIYQLQKEWFPIEYSKTYIIEMFDKQDKGEAMILGAVVDLSAYSYSYSEAGLSLINNKLEVNPVEDEENSILFQKSKEKKKKTVFLIGFLFLSIKKESFFINQVNKSRDYFQLERTCLEKCLYPYYFAYINTLGVIDEFRKTGIGTCLLSKTYTLLESSLSIQSDNDVIVSTIKKSIRQRLYGIYIHVIDYNSTAIKFYYQNGYSEVCEVNDYYNLKGKFFKGKVFYKRIDKEESEV